VFGHIGGIIQSLEPPVSQEREHWEQ
jgi:hypothetical protein